MEINWEEIGEAIANKIMKTDEFRKFCDDQCIAFEDRLNDMLEDRFIHPVVKKNFRFNDGDETDAHFEFVMTMVATLRGAFNKYYVTEYLGRDY